jgi:hypothetical protein
MTIQGFIHTGLLGSSVAANLLGHMIDGETVIDGIMEGYGLNLL